MNGDALSVPCSLRSAALAFPDAAALVGARGTTSYEDLDWQVSAVTRRLGELGPGSRVALYLPKDERYVVLLLALIRAGHVASPVSYRLPPNGVAQLLKRAACSALISDDEDLLQTVGADLRRLRPETLLEEGSRDPDDSWSLRTPLARPATVIFTSGARGSEGGAPHFGNHYHNALGSNANIALRPGDRWLDSLPLYHVGGLSILFRCLLAGATVALPQHGTPLGEAIAGFGATHVSLVSTQLLRLLRENADLRGLQAVLLGGGPVPASLVDEAASRGLPIHTSYGLTEMASQVTTTPPAPRSRIAHLGTGPAQPRGHHLRGRGNSRPGRDAVWGYVEDKEIERPLDTMAVPHRGSRRAG